MREFPSPLSGFSTPFGRTYGALSAYAIGSFEPELVFDFGQEYYRTGGTLTTFDSAMTFDRSSNATMVDSDGLLKWAPHNLLTYSEQLDLWNKYLATVEPNVVVAPDGQTTADKLIANAGSSDNRHTRSNSFTLSGRSTFKIWLKAGEYSTVGIYLRRGVNDLSPVIVNLSTQSITENYPTIVTNSSLSAASNGWFLLSCDILDSASTVVGVFSPIANGNDGVSGFYIWGAHLYRSDLGGMVNSPDRGDSYVPTTSAARYLPRRGHHVYNGSAWVNEGVLHESEARTNLVQYSNDFADAFWGSGGFTNNIDAIANSAISPDGENNAWKLVPNTTTVNPATAYRATLSIGVTAPYVSSVYAKAGEYDYLITTVGSYASGFWAAFDLLNGTVHSQPTDPETTAYIQDVGNGWYRCWLVCTDLAGLEVAAVTPSVDGTLTTNYTDTTSGIYVYGAQFEAGSTPSSYIPTSGSTVTRAADSRSTNAANMPYDATAMSWASDMLITYADTNTATEATLLDWSADANNSIKLTLDTSSTKTGTLTLTVTKAGTSVSVDAPAELTPGLNQPLKVAWRVTTSEINIALNGTAATAVSNIAGVPDLSTASGIFGGMIVAALDRGWAADIEDAGIAEAST